MRVLGIDPGNVKSGYVVLAENGRTIVDHGWKESKCVMWAKLDHISVLDAVAVEFMEPRGMPTSAEEFRAQFESGRIVGFDRRLELVTRREVKLRFCGRTVGVSKSNIRVALIDEWGGPAKAIGSVKCSICNGRGDWGVEGTRKRRNVPGERTKCDLCGGSGWEHPPGPLNELVGDHEWDALAVARLAWERLNI